MVSIVTPSYNQGTFIEETILSVKDQAWSSVEHIIMDGGSTDCTLDILRRYEGTYNMRWNSEPDGGMYQAINKGLRLSHGEVLAYLNSDDRYFPWTVEVAMKELANHDVDFIFGDMLNVVERTEFASLNFLSAHFGWVPSVERISLANPPFFGVDAFSTNSSDSTSRSILLQTVTTGCLLEHTIAGIKLTKCSQSNGTILEQSVLLKARIYEGNWTR